MDTPLNLAHLQERRAELFIDAHHFPEAIQCYKNAAEYLLKAMKMTKVQQALLSMQLQYESNLRQEKILKDRQTRHEVQQQNIELEKLKLKKECIKTNIKHCKDEESTDISDKNRTDNLIASTSSLVISAENFSVSSLSSSTEFLTSRDEKDLMQELKNQIGNLQMQVLSINQSLEDSNRENTKLRKIIASLKEILKERLDMDVDESVILSVEAEKVEN